MISMTAKITRKTVIYGCMILAIPLLILFAVKTADKSLPDLSAATTKQREAFLASYGWQASELESKQTVIPEKFDKTYEKYNALQQSEGFDLQKFAGCSVVAYEYEIKNYGGEDTVYATLLVYDDKVIGGDVHSTALDGFMQGFSR